jgi:hypothetical protein
MFLGLIIEFVYYNSQTKDFPIDRTTFWMMEKVYENGKNAAHPILRSEITNFSGCAKPFILVAEWANDALA